MDQTRHPLTPDALRLDLLRWLDSRDLEHGRDQDTLDEADIALEAALLREGVLSPEDVVESFEPLRWDGTLCGVVVQLEDGTTIFLSSTTGMISNIVE